MSEKCPACDVGNLHCKLLYQHLNFDNGLEFEVNGVLAEVCDNCTEIFISNEELKKRDEKFVIEIEKYFKDKTIPGRIKRWMYKVKKENDMTNQTCCEAESEQDVSDYQKMKDTFSSIGVQFEECDERQLKTEHPVPHAVKYISVIVAHYHFDKDENFLGVECNGDGTFLKSQKA
jgi:hypothetical protein